MKRFRALLFIPAILLIAMTGEILFVSQAAAQLSIGVITIPDEWAGRRIAVNVEYLNSHAAVYVDGKNACEIRFPGGEVHIISL